MNIKLLSYAKINPYLKILRKRPDGYHELDLEFQSISLADYLCLEKDPQISIQCEPSVTSKPTDNIVWKIATKMQKKYGSKDGVKITIKKNIPTQAGLGGGSSNAAVTIIGLNYLWGLDLTREQLITFGKQFGSDIAFFFLGGRAQGLGRGEKINKLPDLPKKYLVLVKPHIGIPTSWAYKRFSLKEPLLYKENHLENVTIKEYPIIKDIKEKLLTLGATKALMSGSGSTVFGIMKNKKDAEQAINHFSDTDFWTKVCYTTNQGVAVLPEKFPFSFI